MIFSKNIKDTKDNKTGMTAAEQLHHIFKTTRELIKKKDRAYRDIMEEIKNYGIELISFNEIEYEDAIYLKKYFKESVFPLLSPQVVGKKQPFPFIKNKEIYAVALLGSKNNEKVGLVPCSNGVFKRLVPIPSAGNKYMLVEELILHFMPAIFDKYQIKSKSLIRIIRNADIDVDEAFFDEEADYRNSVEMLIKQRRKLCPVKMEYSRVPDEKIIKNLCRELNLNKEQIYYSETPLELSFVYNIQDKLRNNKELFYERRIPQRPAGVNPNESMIERIERGDVLLSYPYESMQPFLRLLNEAGRDERVVSIKMTLYRVAKNSQIVETLINAAENGKEVVVLVELRARFDEENNIEWSRRLEDAGCRIIYGIDYIKVHSKLCLITYHDETNEIKYITQVGTGNYNEKTSKLYTDLSLITAMKNKILEYMDREIEYASNNQAAYVGIKINALTDKKIIDKLIECSRAGVKVEMIVRGICCLIPQVEGYTDNISVISIVGRYLEHSRIYIFGTPDRDNIYISSADFMTRNMEKRVEVAAPILDSELKSRIRRMFDVMYNDRVKGRRLTGSGIYVRPENIKDRNTNSQEYFSNEAYAASLR